MSEKMLDEELGYFEEHRQEFLKIGEGKFVLIKGKKHYGFYDSVENAFKAAVEKFGIGPVLIKRVLPEDPIYDIPAYSLGLMYARIWAELRRRKTRAGS